MSEILIYPSTRRVKEAEGILSSLKEMRSRFEEYLQREAFDGFPPVLKEATDHIMKVKGKRIRPVMLLSACEVFGGDINDAMGPASAVEIFHNFSLVHDDIIDNADTRRGKEAVHKAYGINQAILVGDAMLLHSFIQLSKSSPEMLGDLLTVYNKAATAVIEGEQYDVNFEDIPEVSEEEYMMMIQNKTSVLLAASFQLGAIIGGASNEDQEHIYNFGLKLGLAFQIKDDYLDSYGDEKFGKRIGGDIVQNKKTYLLITALQNASPEQRTEIFRLFEEKDEQSKIDQMLELYNSLYVKEKTFDKMEELYDSSLKSLDALSIPDEKKEVLFALAESIYRREH